MLFAPPVPVEVELIDVDVVFTDVDVDVVVVVFPPQFDPIDAYRSVTLVTFSSRYRRVTLECGESVR